MVDIPNCKPEKKECTTKYVMACKKVPGEPFKTVIFLIDFAQ